MRRSIIAFVTLGLVLPAAAAPLADPALNVGESIRQETGEISVSGQATTVVRYTWRDSAGDPRSVSLVPASPSTMGFAVQMSYVVTDAGVKRTLFLTTNLAEGDGGFGYFVSHELFRNFSNGVSNTIAALHGEDDSPLARYLGSTGTAQSVGTTQATHEFRLNYPRWGTVIAIPDPSVVTVSPTLTDHQRYPLPVIVRWHFVAGQDYPLWTADYDLGAASDHIATDIRGPYGVMRFNEGNGPDVTALKWGDKYVFSADATPGDFSAAAINPGGLPWTWNVLNTGRRYNVLASGNYELGLVDILPFSASLYGDGYTNDHRASTSALSGGCAAGLRAMPCDYEWAYQSFQYDYGPPARPKLAWGSSPFLGSSTNPVYITNTLTETISGKGHIHYGLHIVAARAGAGAPRTLARAAAPLEASPTLAIAASPSNGGTVSYTVLGDTAGPYTVSGRALAPWNSVTLTATPAAGATFASWSGACAGVTGSTCIIAMSQSLSVTANFTVPPPPPPAPPARLANLSTRMPVLTGGNVMIAGFIVGGTSSKTLAITATGPSLAPFGIANFLPNPTLQLVRQSDGVTIATNDDWQTDPNAAQLQASGFAPANPLESGLYVNLPPGAYTAIVSGAGGTTGVSVVGVFEVDHPEIPLVNISTRGLVQTGGNVMIGGFIINGTTSQKVAITATGPSLAPFGIANFLANPALQIVRSSDGVTIATNDDWQTDVNASQLQASGFAPGNALEPGLLLTLPPGAYTAIVSGVGGTTGVSVVGVFAVP